MGACSGPLVLPPPVQAERASLKSLPNNNIENSIMFLAEGAKDKARHQPGLDQSTLLCLRAGP